MSDKKCASCGGEKRNPRLLWTRSTGLGDVECGPQCNDQFHITRVEDLVPAGGDGDTAPATDGLRELAATVSHQLATDGNELRKLIATLQAENTRLTAKLDSAELAIKAAKMMRDWFMHSIPEWDKSTQNAIDKFELRLEELEATHE